MDAEDEDMRIVYSREYRMNRYLIALLVIWVMKDIDLSRSGSAR
jgi:hypothetical protein